MLQNSGIASIWFVVFHCYSIALHVVEVGLRTCCSSVLTAGCASDRCWLKGGTLYKWTYLLTYPSQMQAVYGPRAMCNVQPKMSSYAEPRFALLCYELLALANLDF